MNDLISIIVPVFNRKKTIEYCVNSLLKQTYSNIEVILVDDGSTDGSAVLLDKLAERDNRLIVFHTSNHGVSAARNLGLRNAQGKYVIFVDSDDYVDSEYVAQLAEVANSENFVYQNYYMEYIYKPYSIECQSNITPPSHLKNVVKIYPTRSLHNNIK